MKIFLNLFLIIILITFQVSFFPFLDYPVNNLNIILTIIIFITVILNYQLGLYWAAAVGLFIDLYSINNFGVVMTALLVTVICINALFNNFFTNRSFYSLLVLSFLGTLIYNILTLILKFPFYFLKMDIVSPIPDLLWLYNLLWQIVLNITLVSIIFLLFNSLSKKLKSVFLIK